MIESGAARILLCVHEDERGVFQTDSAIPETVGFFDPVWRHIRDINQMTDVSRKKPFGPLVVFQGALREPRRCRKRQQEDCKGAETTNRTHHFVVPMEIE